MAHRVCPPWGGYLLLNPLRRLFENPEKIFEPLVHKGMTVLEPGCGMGYFTLPLARMVGPEGRVVAAEIQEKMLSVLARRAQRAGLMERIDIRHIGKQEFGLQDLSNQVDLAAAIHMVHEVSNQGAFFSWIWKALKPGGKMFVVEPKGHISREEFEKSMAIAEEAGFKPETSHLKENSLKRLLVKAA